MVSASSSYKAGSIAERTADATDYSHVYITCCISHVYITVAIRLCCEPFVQFACCRSIGTTNWGSWLRHGRMNASTNTDIQRLRLPSSAFMTWEETYGHPKNPLTLGKSSTAGLMTKLISTRRLKLASRARLVALLNRWASDVLHRSVAVWKRNTHQ